VRAAGLLGLMCLLVACASLRPPDERLAGELISGRLSVRIDGNNDAAPRALNSGFELEGNSSTGRLDLATPLGTMLAQVRWAPGSAVLTTPQNSTPYSDLDALTQQLLGESVPVAALFDWLRGRPWPGAPSTSVPVSGAPGFMQLGWSVDLASFGEALVVARRERPPVVTVRAKLDRP
jgi:outer membrane lipoprotein LolB